MGVYICNHLHVRFPANFPKFAEGRAIEDDDTCIQTAWVKVIVIDEFGYSTFVSILVPKQKSAALMAIFAPPS
jgi:hypothetical protein